MDVDKNERTSPIHFSRRKAFSGGGEGATPPLIFNLHSLSVEETNDEPPSSELVSPTNSSGYGSEVSLRAWCQELVEGWLEDDSESFSFLEALLQLLEVSLDPGGHNFQHFHSLVSVLDSCHASLKFLHLALPSLIDSDFLHHTDYVDLLLLSLTIYQIHTGTEILGDFVSNTPSFGGFYLRQNGKHFEELFTFIHSHNAYNYDKRHKEMTVTVEPHYLKCMHFPSKKVIVSNAPPIKLKRRRLITREKFEYQVAAGGLVSGIKPSLEKNDVWVSYLDSKLMELEKMPKRMIPKVIRESVRVAPKIRRSTSVLRYSLNEPTVDEENLTEFLYEKTDNDFMSLQRRLERFAEQNFVVNPLIIMKEDHEGFYNGISNGLLWPAFHGLPQYIIHEYLGPEGQHKLSEDWERYMKVNFHFAIHAARSCRQQDFLWIHDYHLFLVGEILRALDPSLDSGFFLHIPFRLSDQFMTDFQEQGRSVLKGLLGFTRVGFQSNRDTSNFIRLVQKHFPAAEVECCEDGEALRYIITRQRGSKLLVTNVGTFPISIKMDKFAEILAGSSPAEAQTLKQSIMGHRSGALFFSVERFDYTKGLLERLDAIDRYFEKYPERRRMDLFYQIAASSRTDVSSYRKYQLDVLNKVHRINEKYGSEEGAVIFVDQQNRPLEDVVQLYQAADAVVVTPMADGMNLVIKEAVMCNPEAVLVLSTGSGAENQLFDAGLSNCYIQVPDINDAEVFADCLQKAVSIPPEVRLSCGTLLHDFTKKRDIDFWINSFTSCDWTASVIEIKHGLELCKRDFQGLIGKVSAMQSKTVSAMHVDQPIGFAARANLQNIIWILENLQKDLQNNLVFVSRKRSCQSLPEVSVADLNSYKQDLKQDLLTIYMLSASVDQFYQSYKDLSEDHFKFEQDFRALQELFNDVYPVDCVIIQADSWLLSKVSGNQSLTSGFLLPRLFSRIAQTTVLLSDDFSGQQLQSRLHFHPEFGALHIGKSLEARNAGTERCARIRQVLDSCRRLPEKEPQRKGTCLFFCGGPNDALLAAKLRSDFSVTTVSLKREPGSIPIFFSTDLQLSSRQALFAASIAQIEMPVTIKI